MVQCVHDEDQNCSASYKIGLWRKWVVQAEQSAATFDQATNPIFDALDSSNVDYTSRQPVDVLI
jgi:hypothetical protein